ncbi:MAG: serine hydrolase, partial [Pseudomonadota bacterium]
QYWRVEGPEDRHTSWSVAKSVVATLIGVALQEGVVQSLDDKASTYAPIYQDTDFGNITIRQLLMMSSGIDFVEDYETPGSDMRRLFFNTFLLQKDVDRFVRQFKRKSAPGQEFEYISPNTSVLGAVLTGAYGGRSLSSLVEEKIFAPMKMDAATWLLDRDTDEGKELAYCCLNMRLEEYAKIGLLYLKDGVVGGQRILPPGWTKFVATPPTPDHSPRQGTEARPFGYGHHFWVAEGAGEAYFASGYNGQYIWIDPAHDVVVAMTGADRNLPNGHTEFLALIQAAAKAAG